MTVKSGPSQSPRKWSQSARASLTPAATGVHLLFEDQTTQKGLWPRAVRANAGAVFTGYLPLNEGQAGGYHHAHKLGQYEFHYDGHILKGWAMQVEAPAVLRNLPRRLRGNLLIGMGNGERRTVPLRRHREAQNDEQGVEPGTAECSPGVFAERSSGVRPEVEGGETLFVHRGDEQVAKWYEWVKGYMAEHPALWETPPKGIRAMARAMSLAESGTEVHEGRFVGIASETCRRIREETPAAEQLAMMASTALSRAGVKRTDVYVQGKRLGVDRATTYRGEDGEGDNDEG
jgi:hypothetical protein